METFKYVEEIDNCRIYNVGEFYKEEEKKKKDSIGFNYHVCTCRKFFLLLLHPVSAAGEKKRIIVTL